MYIRILTQELEQQGYYTYMNSHARVGATQGYYTYMNTHARVGAAKYIIHIWILTLELEQPYIFYIYKYSR